MATQVIDEGKVLAPLNISAPAPTINLRGFQWTSADLAIQQPRPDQLIEEGKPPSVELGQGKLPPQVPLQPTDDSSASHAPSKAAVGPSLPLPTAEPPLPPPPPFPLTVFQGTYAGNGFNVIFRPRGENDRTPLPIKPPPDQPDDNILQLSLTTEQLTFGVMMGEIPNRGSNANHQGDIFLTGLPYLQTVQDATNAATGMGDRAYKAPIHFEPGVWLHVPDSTSPENSASIARMASIPHGTTINAQCLVPKRGAGVLGGSQGGPHFEELDTTPFKIGHNPKDKLKPNPFDSMTAKNKNTPRVPQDLDKFIATGSITTEFIKNPNAVLQKALEGFKVADTVTFEVATGPFDATLNGGGTANISFLAGTQKPITTQAPGTKGNPNAHAESMTSRFWIETVLYEVTVPEFTTRNATELRPNMPKGSTAPTPVFVVSPPEKIPTKIQTIMIPGIQLQYSQTVHLNFANLTWPHVSVATLVPTKPQPFNMP